MGSGIGVGKELGFAGACNAPTHSFLLHAAIEMLPHEMSAENNAHRHNKNALAQAHAKLAVGRPALQAAARSLALPAEKAPHQTPGMQMVSYG